MQESRLLQNLSSRYNNGEGFDAFKLAADGLPIIRAAASPFFALHLSSTTPAERDPRYAVAWAMACASDKLDGFLAQKSIMGPDKTGGKLDQYSDKLFVIPQIAILARNGEIAKKHAGIAIARDIGVTAIREFGSVKSKDIKTDALKLGKYKFLAQATGIFTALVPDENYGGGIRVIPNTFLSVASALSIASGAEQINNVLEQLKTTTAEGFKLVSEHGLDSLDDVVELFGEAGKEAAIELDLGFAA